MKATLTITAIGDGNVKTEWEVSDDPPDDSVILLMAAIEGLFQEIEEESIDYIASPSKVLNWGECMNFEKRVVGIAVSREGEPIYSELTTHVRIADESGGEYVEVEQSGRNDLGKIAIEPEEWPTLRAAIDELVAACRDT